ncbi:MAG: 5'-3' exonuclease [Actinomycetota bacterium]|jgi:5'-3' exonuclease|nr:MAG: 5'-3' exonuclease [Actinomycetota bacterium]
MVHRLLLDVSSLTYRAYFAIRELRAPDGRNVAAVHGYLDMVVRLVASRRPDEVVHVYDHEWRPVRRAELFPGYKANRPADPEDLPPQFELLREVLGPTGMLQAQSDGWEAEDAIGAFCLEADPDDRIEIVSGDRDLIQLVRDPVVRLLFTVRGVRELLEFDEATVLDRYGVPADRYVEFAILRGDPSDGLPGVRGVGEKTARALVAAYPDLDALLADAARDAPENGFLRDRPALRTRLREASGYLDAMRQLVPIHAQARLTVWAGERDDDALRRLAERHGLVGPVGRLIAALDSARAR